MKILLFTIIGSLTLVLHAQKTLSNLLEKHNIESIPYISIDSLAANQNRFILLDAREKNEYKISHLEKAIHVGYNHFKIDSVQKKIPNKTTKIVVYCSLGIRSKSITDSLLKAGYTNVKNLYGGIFEWKNNSLPIYNTSEKETDSIHAFSKKWHKWLKKGIQIYD
ncbi:rhodanese [Pseudalgibacter alginicilyticus]|uniref:Rhodanese n=1 Tax=Pseudalgibacter alginicilyticus TaxID=1736674 RepID=A0A0P0CKZ6_9FLAO|nr:rhodanese-like domain-containing protein [Pseudalgibacter alginicilyticus]ALJ05063.1 rhodanese [Pseudalgibacter alginicilyticus]